MAVSHAALYGARMPVAIRAVFFDVGETLFDRGREYASWARWFGLSAHTFSAVFGAVIDGGGGVADVVERLRPGTGVEQVRRGLAAAGLLVRLEERDLFPGARRTLTVLRAHGLTTGVAGNQPAHIAEEIRALDLPVHTVLTSAELGVAKPDPRFYTALADAAGCAPAQVLYVGDQLGNDVAAALDCGLSAVRVLTGPWGVLDRDPAVEARCRGVLASVGDTDALLTAALSAG